MSFLWEVAYHFELLVLLMGLDGSLSLSLVIDGIGWLSLSLFSLEVGIFVFD